MTACKAALFYVKQFDTAGLSLPFIFAAPIAVIDVPLFSVVYLPQSGSLQIAEINRGALLWKHLVAGRSGIGVYIVRRAELEAFLKDSYTSAVWWTNVDGETLAAIDEK